MNPLPLQAISSSLSRFHFSQESVVYSELKKPYNWRVLDLEPIQNQFQYVNVLCTDGRKYLIIGTEEGLIYIFSLLQNQITGVVIADKWINGLLVSQNKLFSVGITNSIDCFNIRSLRLAFKFPTSREGYGPKGVKLSDTAINNKIIANTGFGQFKIIDAIKLKVIYCFNIAWDTLKEVQADYGAEGPTVINYCVIKRFFKVCYLLQEDGHVYFYNYKEHKLLRKIRLFDFEESYKNNNLMVNSLMLEQDGFLFIVLQFSNNSLDNQKLKSVLFVIQMFNFGEHRKIDVIFFARLCNRIALLRRP